MGNIISISRETAKGAEAPKRRNPLRSMVPFPIIGAPKTPQKIDRTTLRRNVAIENDPVPCPDVRDIMAENARLRADNAILKNQLKVYEMRYGALA